MLFSTRSHSVDSLISSLLPIRYILLSMTDTFALFATSTWFITPPPSNEPKQKNKQQQQKQQQQQTTTTTTTTKSTKNRGEPGLYPSTSEHGTISTPNLDAFGQSGMVFDQAYAGYTVCAPSRTTLMTGYHSGHFTKYGLPGTSFPVGGGPHNVTTIAQMMQGAGYFTGASGKTAPLDEPNQQGFDIFFGQKDQAACHNMYPEVIDNGLAGGNKPSVVQQLPLNAKNKSRALCMANPQLYNYSIDMFQHYGLAFLEQATKQPKPFFLYLSFTVPHAGGYGHNAESGNPVPTDLQYAKESSWPDVEKDHAAVITYLDAYVGAVVRKLDDMGVSDKTIVFFASDNGAHKEGGHSPFFFNSTGGLRGQKRSIFEGGVRSPSMVRWPGTVPANTRSQFQWAFWDVMPTLAQLAGVDVPNPDIDGISILPTLLGQKQPPKEYIFHTWNGLGAPFPPPASPSSSSSNEEAFAVVTKPPHKGSGYGIRQGKWKGAVDHCASTAPGANQVPSMDDVMLLFDLDNDPFETTDLSKKYPQQVKALKQLAMSKDVSCQCFQC